MRIMAVDYGDVRTGLAFSDTTQTLVGDALVINIKNMQEAANKVVQEACARDVSCIIVGYPKNMDGSAGERAKKSERFVRQIEELISGQAIEVKLWDERLTTVSANRILTDAGKRGKKRKQTVDAVAAALILESYLDFHKI